MPKQEQTTRNDVSPEDAKTRRSEPWWVAGLILVVLALNLATGDRCPAVWIDEAAYTDPAWNLHLGHGFTSSAWYAQGPDEFWAGNVPLHSALLYLWTSVFGVSVLAVRAMNYVLISISAVVLWLAVKRLGLVPRPPYRIALVALLLSGFGICFSYRSGRPDAICILLASAAALAYSIPNRTARLATVAALGALFPIAGLQLVVYAALLCLLLLPWLRWGYFAEAVALATGCLAGIGLLFVFYSYHGVWAEFLASTIGRHSAGGAEGLLGRFGGLRIPGGVKDPSFVLVMLAVFTLAVGTGMRWRFAWRSPLGLAIAIGVGMPILLYAMRGQYPCYYAWMTYVPVCICLCSALASGPPVLPVDVGRIKAPALLGPACLVGLPLVLAMTAVQWNDRDYRRIEDLVQRELQPNDIVYCDGAAYYAVKEKARVETGQRHLQAMKPWQKARISALVIDPAQLETVRQIVGGQWRPCGQPLQPSPTTPWKIRSEYFFDQYKLQVFRRQHSLAGRERSYK